MITVIEGAVIVMMMYLTDSYCGADCLGDLLWRGEVQTIIEVIEFMGHAAVNIVRPAK